MCGHPVFILLHGHRLWTVTADMSLTFSHSELLFPSPANHTGMWQVWVKYWQQTHIRTGNENSPFYFSHLLFSHLELECILDHFSLSWKMCTVIHQPGALCVYRDEVFSWPAAVLSLSLSVRSRVQELNSATSSLEKTHPLFPDCQNLSRLLLLNEKKNLESTCRLSDCDHFL